MTQKQRAPTDGGPTFPLRHRVFRMIWSVVWATTCAWTPPQLWRWRALVLRCFGARIGDNCDIRGTARIWYPPNLEMADWSMLADGVICYNPASIRVGRGTLVSQRAHLCAASHDFQDVDFPLTLRPIELGEQVWIAAEAFVGPGVSIGNGAVLGARAAAFNDLGAWQVHRGNPAQQIRSRKKVDFMASTLRTSSAKTGEPI
jgi:putative colanic acid biosynthesis acetyltransferase WcaF